MSEAVSNTTLKVAPITTAPVSGQKEEKSAVPVVAESQREGRTWSWEDVKKGAKYAGIGAVVLAALYHSASLWEVAKNVPAAAQASYTVVTEGIPATLELFKDTFSIVMLTHIVPGYGLATLRQTMNLAGIQTPPVPTDFMGLGMLGLRFTLKAVAFGIAGTALKHWGPTWKITKCLFEKGKVPFATGFLTWAALETAAPGLTRNVTVAAAQMLKSAKNLTNVAINQTKEFGAAALNYTQENPVETTYITMAGLGASGLGYYVVSRVASLALPLFTALRARFGRAAPAPAGPVVPQPQVVLDAAAIAQIAEAVAQGVAQAVGGAAPGAA